MNGKILGLIPSNTHTHTTPTYNPGHKTQPGQRTFHWLPRLLRSVSCKTSWRRASKRTYENAIVPAQHTKVPRPFLPHTSIQCEGKGENAKFSLRLERIPNRMEVTPPASKTTTTTNKNNPKSKHRNKKSLSII